MSGRSSSRRRRMKWRDNSPSSLNEAMIVIDITLSVSDDMVFKHTALEPK